MIRCLLGLATSLTTKAKSHRGYFETYATCSQGHKVMLEQTFGKIAGPNESDVRTSFLKHIDHLNSLSPYRMKISIGEASSHEQFYNFHEITVDEIYSRMLYGSVNPLDTSEKAQYADAFAKTIDVKNEINLTDKSKDVDKRPPGNSDRCCLNLCRTGNMFFDEVPPYLFNNTSKIKSYFKCILDSNGPFLVHCKEGKDHTGMCFILLEGICGASIDRVMKNYMQMMVNFYNVIPGSDDTGPWKR